MTRIEREKKVVATMIAAYCRARHGTDGKDLCTDCRELLDYVLCRMDRCPKGPNKKSCRVCDIHCYSSTYRAKIRAVMRYMGPRMLFIHPVTAIRHLLSEL